MAAIEKLTHWTYLVFTFPQSTKRLDKEAFTSGCRKWAAMRKRITHRFGHIQYIQTWEIHKSGWPHVNCLVSNRELFDQAVDNYRKLRRKFFIPANVEIGFGRRIWVEPMKNARHMGGYLTKLGLELVGGEHKNQLPVNAPKHFRRIRASRGLLPKKHKDESKTGQLFKCGYDYVRATMERHGGFAEQLTSADGIPHFEEARADELREVGR
jgi:hypothetical protein